VLQGVSLRVREGECLGVVGPNGSGKTTLLKVLAGLIEPRDGAVMIMGRQMSRTPPDERALLMGIAFQNPGLGFFNPTVAKEAAAGRMLDQEEVSSLLARVNLGGMGARSPFTLSEGEKRRLALASALAGGGKLILLDEPTAGLGAHSRRLLVETVRSLLAEGVAVVAVSHDLEFLEEVAGTWLVLKDGRVEKIGGPDAIMADTDLMERARLRATQFHAVRKALAAAEDGSD
jgi:energy-coupling factor transport system ATP-binding protein